MSDTITLRLQISPEDLRKAGYDVSKIGEKPITLKLPQKPLGDLPEQAKFAEGTVGALKEKMAKLNSEIDHLKDQGAIKAKQAEIKALGGQVDDLTGKLKPTGGKNVFAEMLPSITSLVTAGGALGIALSVVSTGFSDLMAKETAMADLRAITGLTAEEVKKLANNASELSMEFGTGVVQNIDAMKTILSKLGPEMAADTVAMESMTRSINLLSKTTPALADTAKTADILSNAVNAFIPISASAAEKAAFMARSVDVLASGAKAGTIEADQISESLLKMGSTASNSNVSIEESVALIEVLGVRMANGSENGNALKNVMLKLNEGRFMQKEVLEELEKAGVNVALLSDKSKTFAERLSALNPVMNDSALLAKMFGSDNIIAATQVVQNVEAIKKMTEETKKLGVAQEQVDIQMATTTEKWDRLTNFLRVQVVKVFEQLQEKIVGVAGVIEDLASGEFILQIGDHFKELWSNITGEKAEFSSKAFKAAFAASKDLTVQFDVMRNGGLAAMSLVGQAAQKTAKILEMPTVEIEGTADALNKLKGAPAGSLAALEEAAQKLEALFRNMKVNDPNWFNAKEAARLARENIELITSGAAQQYGNDIDKLKAYIKQRAAEGDIPPILAAFLGDPKDAENLKEVKVPPMNINGALEEWENKLEAMKDSAKALGLSMGADMAAGINAGEPIMKAALKSVLVMILDYLEKEVVLAQLALLLKSIISQGPIGFLTAVALMGAIAAPFELAKAAVKGFATGGIIVGERGPEVIAPAKEFSEFAGSIVSNAIGFMAAAMGKLNDMEMASRRIDVNSNVQFNQARVAIEGHQLVAYLNAHSYREQRASLGW